MPGSGDVRSARWLGEDTGHSVCKDTRYSVCKDTGHNHLLLCRGLLTATRRPPKVSNPVLAQRADMSCSCGQVRRRGPGAIFVQVWLVRGSGVLVFMELLSFPHCNLLGSEGIMNDDRVWQDMGRVGR